MLPDIKDKSSQFLAKKIIGTAKSKLCHFFNKSKMAKRK